MNLETHGITLDFLSHESSGRAQKDQESYPKIISHCLISCYQVPKKERARGEREREKEKNTQKEK